MIRIWQEANGSGDSLATYCKLDPSEQTAIKCEAKFQYMYIYLRKYDFKSYATWLLFFSPLPDHSASFIYNSRFTSLILNESGKLRQNCVQGDLKKIC